MLHFLVNNLLRPAIILVFASSLIACSSSTAKVETLRSVADLKGRACNRVGQVEYRMYPNVKESQVREWALDTGETENATHVLWKPNVEKSGKPHVYGDLFHCLTAVEQAPVVKRLSFELKCNQIRATEYMSQGEELIVKVSACGKPHVCTVSKGVAHCKADAASTTGQPQSRPSE